MRRYENDGKTKGRVDFALSSSRCRHGTNDAPNIAAGRPHRVLRYLASADQDPGEQLTGQGHLLWATTDPLCLQVARSVTAD
jgi:hypothetical protein